MRGSQKNKDYKPEWSPKIAYVVGLLTTDGNLSKDGRHINFTSKDIQLVKTFKKCLGLTDVKIGRKTNGFTNKKYPYIQFSNTKLYRWLGGIGLEPNKSKRIGVLKIPEKYFFDFLRGHFDGDGSFYAYWDPRWKKSFMFYISFVSASLNHLKWLRNYIKTLSGLKGSISKSANSWTLRYAKKESRILFSRIYHEDNLPCLKRKYRKLRSFLSIDNGIKKKAQVA